MNDERSGTATCKQCGEPLCAVGSVEEMCLRCAWLLVVDEDDLVGEELMNLPGLRVVSEIARGGMGVVYRAVEAEAGREVAVKMMPPSLADTAEVRERFAQEARAMGALDHPGVLPVYRVGQHRGLPFFSMKLAEGGTLQQHLSRYASDWRGIAELMAGIAEAVHHAHQRGLLHRDLKPANILFDAAGRAYVSDFGLVKVAGVESSLTRSVSVLGTPHYMAPEVAERDAQAASVASDVWSLGAILYELMAQRLAFQAEGVPALLRKIVDETPEPLPSAAPRDLATIALKCLQKVPARRYASAGELADDLLRWLRGEPVLARRLPATARLLYWARRRPALAAMSLILATSVAGGAVLVLLKNRELKNTLRTSLVNEARTIRVSARVQEREAGLTAVSKAAKLGSSPELEEEAASLLAMPSMKLLWQIEIGPKWRNLIPDADLRNGADFRHDDGVRIVELATQRELAKLTPGAAYSLLRDPFSNDGRLLLYRDKEKNKLVVCEWNTGRVLRQLSVSTAFNAQFSPDSKSLAVGLKDGRIALFDLVNNEAPPVIWPAGGLAVARPLAFSPDGRRLLAADDAHEAAVYEVKSGAVQGRLGINGEGAVISACWFADSKGVLLGTNSGMVRAWPWNGGTSRLLPDHAAQVYAVAVQPEGQLALSSAFEGRTWVFDWPSGRVMGMEQGNSLLTRFSRDGSRLTLGNEGLGLLRIFEVATSSVCRQFVSPNMAVGRHLPKGSWNACVRPTGRLLAVTNYGSTDLFDLATSRHLGTLPEGNGNSLVWSTDGSELWLGQGTTLIRRRFEDRPDGSIVTRRIGSIDLQGHTGLRLSLSEKADRWAVSTADGVFTGRVTQDESFFIPAPPEIPGKVELNPLAMSPDGRWAIVSSDYSNKLGVLDLNERRWAKILDSNVSTFSVFRPDSQSFWLGKRLSIARLGLPKCELIKEQTDLRDTGGFTLMATNADGRLLASLDGMVVILRHGETGEPFLRLRHSIPLPCAWISLTPDGHYLIVSGLGHVVQMWDLPRLAVEMKKLGLPWRGPDLGDAKPPQEIKSVQIDP